MYNHAPADYVCPFCALAADMENVWHYHLHVIPRYTGDNFYSTWGENMPAPRRAELARQLKAHLMNWKPMPQKPPIRNT